jgi:hypothetical protein
MISFLIGFIVGYIICILVESDNNNTNNTA